MKRLIALLMCTMLVVSLFASCGGETVYKDGIYTARSENYEGDDAGNGEGYGEVKITIKDGKISDCEFKTYTLEGELKDEDYGKLDSGNKDAYNMAQKAIAACEEYSKRLVENNGYDDIDVISGATINYNQFLDAVSVALSKAKE
ncbi:MAG: FMN-binding protein [Ruminococcus sp.]|nr:FMN-binding protein [Ruminococcus sp.]